MGDARSCDGVWLICVDDVFDENSEVNDDYMAISDDYVGGCENSLSTGGEWGADYFGAWILG